MPAQPLILGFKSRLRVEDLVATDFIETRCDGCGHKARIGTWMLHARYVPLTLIDHASGRWKCQSCGVEGRLKWSLWRAHPPASLVAETKLQRIRRERREAEVRQRIEERDGNDKT